MRITAKIAAALALTGLGSSALAQDFLPGMSPMDYMQTNRVVTDGFINKAVNESAFGFGRTGSRRGTPPRMAARPIPSGLIGRSAGGPVGRPVALPYASSAAAQQQAKQEFLARLRSKDPKTAEIATVQFQKNDIGRIYAGITRPFGLSPNDAGDVVTAYLVLAWMVANGAGDPSAAGVRAARAHIGALLAQGGPVADPAMRVAVAEEMKILFVVMHSGWQAARREGNVRPYADGTAEMFRTEMGDDLRRIVLTDAGFRARG